MSRPPWSTIYAALAFAVCPALPNSAAAQDHAALHAHPAAAPLQPASPYSGLESRTVKALSAAQIDDLRQGHGMGLAMAAELNGYPGPLHALELADSLGLTEQQLAQTRALLDAMKAETIPIGVHIIADETALDRLFAEHRITRPALEETTARIAKAEGALRAAHLGYHLRMMAVLTPAQIAFYAELRGYAGLPR